MQSLIAANNPEIDVDLLMQRIREEIAQRPTDSAPPGGSVRPAQPAPPLNDMLRALTETATVAALPQKSVYALRDFLDYHDEAFIVNAYRGVLRREPDSSGMTDFLGKLRHGDYTKIEILGRLRFSPEGRRHGVRIRGLIAPFALQTACRLPVLGYGIAWLNFILRLPVLIRNWQRFEAHSAFRADQNHRVLAESIRQMSGFLGQLQRDASQLAEGKASQADFCDLREKIQQMQQLADEKASQQQLTDLYQQLQDALAHTASQQQLAEVQQQLAEARQQVQDALAHTASQQQLAEVQQQLTEARQQVQDALAHTASQQQLAEAQQQVQEVLGDLRRQLFDHKRTLLDQQRRLGLLLEEARKRLPAPLNSEQLNAMLNEDEHRLDAMYATFEDQFRGTREDIKQRQRIYLPLIQQCQAGTDHAPVLDIGCGRGEWLELLRDQRLVGRGVDLNRVFVQQCLEDHLHVIEQDAIAYLRSLPHHALGAITGFHIIEHLPIRTLIALFDEALRVLQPGGVAIFETPNPGNLLVGSCNFYLDPTHRNPLPAPLSRYLIEARGFIRAEIIELHPFDAGNHFSDGPPATMNRLNQHFFGPQDYAVVAYKAES